MDGLEEEKDGLNLAARLSLQSKNDNYLIKKLKQNNLTPHRIEDYLVKLKAESTISDSSSMPFGGAPVFGFPGMDTSLAAKQSSAFKNSYQMQKQPAFGMGN